ncbi:hypothetical protein [Microbulbifer rhizosphaerae]|uniref:Ankyrin repeat protein n=1 Tax=Microbulbifer rhizosphaerae TaxID=1562603 RepID=A0A7W4W7W2_9GAMM|nr:hypothetical protein [Microbulbifer rhizosphaerae]MBB3059268.1 hypothetical protein [Microbulbifer rhizosphaerae]
MINYRFEKEKEISLHYAHKLGNIEAVNILVKGEASNSEEAVILAKFFWLMVDSLIEDSKNSIEVCGEVNLEEWSECLFNSFRAYFKSSGFSSEWDSESDMA